MKQLLTILVFLMFYSCIPLRIAPKIESDKVMIAKKFKKNLPRSYALIFEDPKDANEFYNYIDIKYELNHQNVDSNVPFIIEGEKFFLSFYETEISTKTINLVPIIIDAKLESEGIVPIFEGNEFSRIGNWYLVLTVSDLNMDDCLDPNHKYREKVIKFLQSSRVEYLNTYNYNDALFKKR